jgi:hypothetical protein
MAEFNRCKVFAHKDVLLSFLKDDLSESGLSQDRLSYLLRMYLSALENLDDDGFGDAGLYLEQADDGYVLKMVNECELLVFDGEPVYLHPDNFRYRLRFLLDSVKSLFCGIIPSRG